MFRTIQTFARLAQAVVVGVAATALVASAALASTSSRYGAKDPWFGYAVSHAPTSQPDPWLRYAVSLTRERPLQAASSNGFITDTLGGNGQPTASPGYRLITDTLGGKGTPTPTPGMHFITDTLAPGGGLTPAPALPSNGFDWQDAGIGAGIALGLVAAALSGSVVVRRRRRLAF